jgi:transposase-like protein
MADNELVSGREGGLRALTPVKEDAIVAAVSRGVPPAAAAKTMGIGERTLRGWLRVAAEDRTTWEDGVPITPKAKADVLRFALKVEQALAECEARCASAITSAIGVVGKSGVPEWRPALEWLKHSPNTRERWHEYRQVDINHTVDRSPAYAAARLLSDEELERQLRAAGIDPETGLTLPPSSD